MLGWSREDLARWLGERDQPAYRADQIRRWLFQRLSRGFEEMTDLPRSLRNVLGDSFAIAPVAVVDRVRAGDGTTKFLMGLRDGVRIEAVLMPEKGRFSLCISSQAGCAQGCRFCYTGAGGLERNLTAGEILGQVLEVRRSMETPEALTHIVFMGMGEPLANYGPVLSAIETLVDADTGPGFSPRRITLSTVGLVPGLQRLGRDARVNLAVSLNAADDETRSRLMPVNRIHPVARLIEACRAYPLEPRRRITFEVVLLEGVNDRPSDARRLARLLRPVRCKVNLIPFNPHEACDFRTPTEAAVAAFQRVLLDHGYTAVVRRSKGLDIKAACGQLRGAARSHHEGSDRLGRDG